MPLDFSLKRVRVAERRCFLMDVICVCSARGAVQPAGGARVFRGGSACVAAGNQHVPSAEHCGNSHRSRNAYLQGQRSVQL